MAVIIMDERMTSDLTTHWAIPKEPGQPYDKWVVSWLHDRYISRNAAITAMALAEIVTQETDRQIWSTFAAELGVTADEAVKRISYGFEITSKGKR